MAQLTIGGNLGNYKNRLGYIHIPKCAGNSIAFYLHNLGEWHAIDDNLKSFAAEPFNRFKTYRLFTVVRHPVSWILSGYKFYKQRRNYNLSFSEHVDRVVTDYTPTVYDENFDWYWHCKILPDAHIGHYKPKVFKLEQLDELKPYLNQWFPNANKFSIGFENATRPEQIEIKKHTMQKIKKYTGSYADKYEYEF